MKNYGLLDELFEFGAYILGGNKVPYIHYNPSGNWEKYLPEYEPQAENYETNGCTVWGTQNQIEIFHKFLYDKEPNYSERFTYNLVPVKPASGSDPQKVYDCIREYGLIDNRYLPVPDTIEEFLDMSKITDKMYDRGKKWKERYELKHEWLWTLPPKDRTSVIRDALKTSPIAVSVTAWMQDGNNLYIDNGIRNNHWCVAYKVDDDGGIWVLDSYNHYTKKLHPDHYIHRAKRIWLNRKTKSYQKKHIRILEEILKQLMLFKKPTLLELAEQSIGTDVTPDDMVPDTVACAISLTTLINQTDKTFPKVAGTWTLWDILEHRSDYQRVTVPTPGCIVVSPTGTGNGSIPGHAGIIMADNTIASNDSATGKFIKNYTLDTWRARYVDKGGYKIFMYKKIV